MLQTARKISHRIQMIMTPAMTRIIVLSETKLGIVENSLWYATTAPMSFQWIQSTVLAAEPSCMKFVLSVDTDILRSTRYASKHPTKCIL